MATSKLPNSYLGFLSAILSLFLLSQPFTQPAVSLSRIEFLPGFDGALPFELETGYVGVDESEDVQLFYYFFESEDNYREGPLLLWLTGGPGCSTVSAIFFENGPLKFVEVKYDGRLPRLTLNPHSWTKTASIIFVDMPVGTGFSYARVPSASHSSDFIAARHANEFLRKWLMDHPKFLTNPVYLAGDSYSGFTVPVYFEEMRKGNEKGMEPFINLKGYMLGNPVTDPPTEDNSRVAFVHGMGLISDELYESLQAKCHGNIRSVDPRNVECVIDVQDFYRCISGVQSNQVLEPVCAFASPMPHELLLGTGRRFLEDEHDASQIQKPSLRDFYCRSDGYLLAFYFLNDKEVQKALHVHEGSIGEWVRCNYGINYTTDIWTSVPYHANLTAKGYRALIYSGDHDMVVPFRGTEVWIKSLNYSIVDDWRPWMVDGQVAGFTRTYSNNMTFATVKGGGHTAPEYRPKECVAMFRRWVSGDPL
ncbi:hypothetical protein Nepgr_019826 [Nepenthes gracilis]|uniref:Serine carboxypeptidase-like 7 n=1 Tax=Nepenthes gracilis TaxID=150966 RepID=A0AAD3XVK7_NEPGR|nr:hypothetical protein Nepgr_019826 [Nepenthes gracilis]